MIRKVTTIIISIVMAAAICCGCSKTDDKEKTDSAKDTQQSKADDSVSTESAATDSDAALQQEQVPDPKLMIDGKEVDTEGLTMLTVDGKDIDFTTFRYYYYTTLQQLNQYYGVTIDTIKETEDGYSMLLENVVNNIKQDYVTYRLVEENNIELSDEDKASNDEMYQGFHDSVQSDEEYEASLKQAYLTDDLLKERMELASLYIKCEDLFTGEGKYATKKDDFREIVQNTDEYACMRSILIPEFCKVEITDEDVLSKYDSYSLAEKYDAKKAAFDALSDEEKEKVRAESEKLAKEVMEKVNADNFEEMLTEYGWDPGMESAPEGYYVTHNTTFVQEFIDASFALEVGAVSSELVKSDSYGWFILKRNPVDMDYVEENIDSLIQNYDLPARQQLYMDIMDDMEVKYSDYYDKLTIDSIS